MYATLFISDGVMLENACFTLLATSDIASLLPERTKLLALSKNDLEITLSANLYKLSKELTDSICQYPVDLSSFLYATLSNLTAEDSLFKKL